MIRFHFNTKAIEEAAVFAVMIVQRTGYMLNYTVNIIVALTEIMSKLPAMKLTLEMSKLVSN